MSAISSVNNQNSIFQLANSISSGAPSSTGSLTSSSSSGGASISPVGQLFSDLQQLQQSNPAQFKSVVSQLATQFQAAAQQQGAGTGSGILSNIANKLQSVANGGSLSQAEGTHHHHGHKGQQAYGSQSSQSQGLTQLLASLQNTSDSTSSSSSAAGSSNSSGSSSISSVLTSALQTVTQALSA